MSKAEVMKSYLPTYERKSQVIGSILEATGPEVDQIYTSIDDMLKQFYVETVTETGLDLWEKMLGLTSYAGKPLDQRRSRIISKLRGMGTVTVSLIKSVAEAYANGRVEVIDKPTAYSYDTYREITLEPYTFIIRFIDQFGVPPNINDLKQAIEEIKPAHLAVNYVFNYLYWDKLDEQNLTWDQLDAKGLTWAEFESGAWLNP